MMNWKQNILFDTRKQLRHRKGKDEWLDDRPIHFSRQNGYAWQITSEYQTKKVWELFEYLPLANRKETRYAYFQLIACLLKYEWKPIRISRNESNWRKDNFNKIGVVVIDIMDTLLENDLIDMKPGYWNEEESKRFQTRIWATDKLLEACPVYPKNIARKPFEVVLKKGKKDKNGNRPLVEYKETKRTLTTRKKLQLINAINVKADIRYFKYQIFPYMQAQFVERFTWDGRLYTSGYRHVQGFSEDERAELTINGETVVEADFSGLHPHILYSWEGIQYNKDPYTQITDDQDARTFLKMILLFMVNAEDQLQAERAANDWLYKFPRKNKKGERRKRKTDYKHQYLVNRLNAKGIAKAGPLIELFMEAHEPIAKYLCNGSKAGHKLRFTDGRIALNVMHHFAEKEYPILGIHDSFLMQQSMTEKLIKVMKKEYKKQTGGYRILVGVK